MTPFELRELLSLRRQREIEEHQIKDLHANAVFCGTLLKNTPGIKGGDKDRIGKCMAQLLDLEKEHIKTLEAYTARERLLNEWYKNLPQCQGKEAIYWHYYEIMPWATVSRKMHSVASPDALRMAAHNLLAATSLPEE